VVGTVTALPDSGVVRSPYLWYVPRHPTWRVASNSCSPDTDSARCLLSSATSYQLNKQRGTAVFIGAANATYRISMVKRHNYGPEVTETKKPNIAVLKRGKGSYNVTEK